MSAEHILPILSQLRIIDDPASYDRQLQIICYPQRPYVLSFLNQHGVNLIYTNNEFREALLGSDCVLRDGVGLEIALRLLGLNCGMNCNGTDLIPSILQKKGGCKVATFGTKDPWLEKSCEYIKSTGSSVVSKVEGFNQDQFYVLEMQRTKPDIIILGMGMPRQEELSIKLAQNCDHACLIINGGAILDFLGQRFSRAPRMIRTLRLEWMFRLFLEPRRLFKRYVAGGLTFIFRILCLVWHARINNMNFRISTKD